MDDTIDEAHLRFKHPCTILAAGPTGSGKTVLVRKILQHYNECFENISSPPSVIWCYGQWQASYLDNVGNGVQIQYHEGLINERMVESKRPDIVIVDDLMNELGGDDALVNLFTKGSHHLNLTVIFIVQNVFHKGPHMRTISLNSHYMVLLKNPRDKSQIINLARQLYPTQTRFLQEA
jgi:Cdc6-like AAA superfamily ATPase